jgi:hypothetical protein
MIRCIFRLWIPLICLLLSDAAPANLTHRYELTELVRDSQKIFIGTVSSVYTPHGDASGISEVATVKVDLVYKGKNIGRLVKVVSKGVFPELFMACCVVGGRYIFFVRDGYDVLVVDGQEVETRVLGVGEYVSPTNGRFSSYRLDRGRVLGWKAGSGNESAVGLDQAVRQVRALLGGSQSCRRQAAWTR